MALNPRTDKIVGAIDIKHPILDEVSRVIKNITNKTVDSNLEITQLNHIMYGGAVSKIVGAIDLKHPVVDELRIAMNTIKVPEHIIDRNVGSLSANQYPYINTVVENKRQ
jgi:hypothetical protein